MISRTSDEYVGLCGALGVPVSMRIPMPRELLEMSPGMLEILKIMIKGIRKKSSLTRMLNSFRRRGTNEHIVENDDYWYRAFFVTSTSSILVQDVQIRGDVKVLKMYGGKCMQIIQHYHYVFITDFSVKIADINILQDCSVLGIWSNTDKARAYIKDQLVEAAYNFSLRGHEFDAWYNPRFEYSPQRMVNVTNSLGLGGVFCDVSKRSGDLHEVVQVDDYAYSFFITRYTGLSCTNMHNYKNQYNIIVTRGLFDPQEVYDWFNSNAHFLCSRVILIR